MIFDLLSHEVTLFLCKRDSFIQCLQIFPKASSTDILGPYKDSLFADLSTTQRDSVAKGMD